MIANPEFNDLVNRDIRDQVTPTEHSFLRDPDNRAEWETALKTFKRNSETQLASRRADKAEKYVEYLSERMTELEWAEYVSEYEQWRSKVIRFKNGVEQKLQEARSLAATHHRNWEQLADGIRRHKAAVYADDDELDVADQDLYAMLTNSGNTR